MCFFFKVENYENKYALELRSGVPSCAEIKFVWAVEADIPNAMLARDTPFGVYIVEFEIKMD